MNEGPSSEILLRICETLNKHNVKFLIVGGTAVIAHGYSRPTTDLNGNILTQPDFDFWFSTRYLNYQRLLDAFDELSLDTKEAREEEIAFPKSSFFRFKPAGYTLDFLPRVGGELQFDDCFSRRSTTIVNDIEIPILGLSDLIQSKKAIGRKKDFQDIKALKEIMKTKSRNQGK